MRSTLILLSFALTLIAVPVPVAETNAPVRREFFDNAAKRYMRNNDGGLENREVSEREFAVSRAERRTFRGSQRSADDEPNIEKRTFRGSQRSADMEKRTFRGSQRSADDELDIEKRTFRGSQRSADMEKRTFRGSQRSTDVEPEVEERGIELKSKARSLWESAGMLPEKEPM